MAAQPAYLLDTNILLRLANASDVHHDLASKVVESLSDRGSDICWTPQNVGEFWNVCTRPADRNGLGLSPDKADELLDAITETITLLPESDRIYPVWRSLLLQYRVSGIQVYDARLVAVMKVHGLSHILTFNTGDFERFTDITAVHPADVQV